VDVLAIDRAGTGDVHVVEIMAPRPVPFLTAPMKTMRKTIDRLMLIPAQFRWIAVAGSRTETPGGSKVAPDYLYPTEEMGRIGVMVFYKTENDSLGARIRYAAERFRGNLAREVDAFVAKIRPDIEVR
jgi:hypothetical protein